MGTDLDSIFDGIRNACEKTGKTFAEVICEAFYLFDDGFEEMDNNEVNRSIQTFIDTVEEDDEL